MVVLHKLQLQVYHQFVIFDFSTILFDIHFKAVIIVTDLNYTI